MSKYKIYILCLYILFCIQLYYNRSQSKSTRLRDSFTLERIFFSCLRILLPFSPIPVYIFLSLGSTNASFNISRNLSKHSTLFRACNLHNSQECVKSFGVGDVTEFYYFSLLPVLLRVNNKISIFTNFV